MNYTKNQSAADFFGAAVSSLCLIHCVLTPFVFVAKPILDGVGVHSGHEHTGWWGMLDPVFLTLSLLAVWYAAYHTPFLKIRLLFWAFWIVFATGLLLEMNASPIGEWLMYAGSIALATTHVFNYRYCKACSNNRCD